MANTTNFGWETPDDTDLVKDGALAMRTLGNAIDASMVDLKGGTTGQVLSKNSNTDMDFTWVTSDDANAIQNAIVDAKGDLIAASAADTPARLAVGNDGETLVADSSTSTGLRYNPQNALVNPVINGGFDIWQRGTSFVGGVTSAALGPDRWNTYRNGAGSTFSRQTTSDTTNLPNIQYCTRVARDSGNTSTNSLFLFQDFESVNSTPFAGKTVTLSFYARAGANYSATSNGLIARLMTGTGTDQSQRAGYTNSNSIINSTATLTTSWQRFAYTATVGATATQLGIQFEFSPIGTAGANDYFEVTGVQIDLGTYTASSAPTFRRSGGTLAGELAAAMRYYERFTSLTTNARMGAGIAVNTTSFNPTIYFTVPKRASANVIDYANLTTYDSGVRALTSLAFSESNLNCVSLTVGVASGLTVGRTTELISSATGGYIGFSAEL